MVRPLDFVGPVAPALTSIGVGVAQQQSASVKPTGGTLYLVGAGGALVTVLATDAGFYFVDTFTGGLDFSAHNGFSGTAPPATYTITDSASHSASNTYTPTVLKPDPPVATTKTSTRSEGVGYQYADTSDLPNDLVFLLSGGQQVTRLVIPNEGTYSASSGDGIVLAFQAAACYVGPVPTVTYRMTDLYGQSSEATYTAHVTNGPAPTAAPLTSTGVGGNPQTVTVPQPDCGATTKLVLGGTLVDSFTRVGEGTYRVNPATGAITFTPAPGYAGTGAPVDFRITDPQGQTASSTYTVTVTTPPAPTSTPITSTGVGTALQHGSPTVPAGGNAAFIVDGSPTNHLVVASQGVFDIDATSGLITFTPEPGYLGTTDPVTFRLSDTYGQSTQNTYTPTVTEPAAPAPANLTSSGAGTQVQHTTSMPPKGGTVYFLDNGSASSALTIPGQGTYTVDPTTGSMSFAPLLGYTGAPAPASFRVTDSYGQSGTATYSPTVTVPPAPPAPPLTSTAPTGTSQSRTVTIPPGGSVTLLNGTNAVNTVTFSGQGTYTLNSTTGVITFTAAFGFSGTASPVTYQVTDAYGQGVRSTYGAAVTALPAVAVVPVVTPVTLSGTVVAAGGAVPTSVPAGSGGQAAAAASPTSTSSVDELLLGVVGSIVLLGSTLTIRRRRATR